MVQASCLTFLSVQQSLTYTKSCPVCKILSPLKIIHHLSWLLTGQTHAIRMSICSPKSMMNSHIEKINRVSDAINISIYYVVEQLTKLFSIFLESFLRCPNCPHLSKPKINVFSKFLCNLD